MVEDVWINQATGELLPGPCPKCAEHEADVGALENEVRRWRRAVTRLQKTIDGDVTARRDGALWAELTAYWIERCGKKPDALVPMKGIRATLVFRLLEAGASVEKVKLAIDGAALAPYKSYGHRTAKKFGKRLDDLKDICKDEAEFEALVAIGEAGEHGAYEAV